MTPSDLQPPSVRRRRYQFTTRTLLVAFFLAACVIWWFVQNHKLREARSEFEGVQAAYEAGVITTETLLDASNKLCRIEEQMPFADKVRARPLNVARTAQIVANFRYSVEHGEGLMGASTQQEWDAVYARLQKLDDALNEAQEQLRAAKE